ncbi:MAG: class II fructose-bisphosphate aldolase, partial [Halanaerobiales bacterium]
MTKKNEIDNLFTLNEVLEAAEKGKYAVGAFSARYIPMILPILKAGERANSLLILQISEYELDRYNIDLSDFAAEFFRILKKEEISIPVVLHLDHTREFKIIKKAIKENFTSVMIDASSKTYEENTAITKKVVEYAEKHDVSVEAELGQIGSTDTIETEGDEELFTDPGQAQKFVSETGVDALAVSVGTAHGVYNEVTQPSVDYERIKAIKKLTPV